MVRSFLEAITNLFDCFFRATVLTVIVFRPCTSYTASFLSKIQVFYAILKYRCGFWKIWKTNIIENVHRKVP